MSGDDDQNSFYKRISQGKLSIEDLRPKETLMISVASGIVTSSSIFLFVNKMKPVLLSGTFVCIGTFLGLRSGQKYRILSKPILHDPREKYDPES